MNRKDILDAALAHTCEREDSYGDPKQNMADIGSLWTTYMSRKHGAPSRCEITAEDVAWMLNLLKMARSFTTKKPDTYEDAAAYAAIAGECAV